MGNMVFPRPSGDPRSSAGPPSDDDSFSTFVPNSPSGSISEMTPLDTRNSKRKRPLLKQRALTRSLVKKYWAKFDALDRFAVQPEPASRLGAGLTLFVWGATILYIVISVFQWINKPPVVAANVEWSIDKGPFLMLMECHARSGCLVSSNLPVADLDSTNSTLADGRCIRVPHLGSLRVPMVYTEAPREGVSVIYDPSSSDDKVLPRFGVTTVSEIQCKPEKGKGCVDYRGSAAGPGVSDVTIVKIANQTEVGAAKLRLLAFSGTSTMNETVDPTSSCKPDPDWKAAAHSILVMGPVYFDVAVWVDGFWLYLWGSAGGAYSSFLEVCTILLVTYALASKVYKKTLQDKVARLWAPGRPYAPDPDRAEGKQVGPALV